MADANAGGVIGCTDKDHSRLAISDLAVRYLIPTINFGVSMEGGEGEVSGQIIQLVKFLPATSTGLFSLTCSPRMHPL